ncbi:hypothetical protein EHM69_03470 [candidate division KSB1 bacterium]|nr:MAG: hypothetical protein EHM69_03470 [candidate division KSB1 bacterium]
MRIQNVHGTLRGLDQRELKKTEDANNRPISQEKKSEDGDSLDVSLSSRISALSVTNETDRIGETSELTPQRIQEIQGRIESGFYNTPSTSTAIADRLLNFYSK